MKKKTLIPISGIAAAIVVAAVLFFPADTSRTVHAAMIIERLNRQIEQSPLFEITLERLDFEGVSVNGNLQASSGAVAGDISVKAERGDADEQIDVDLTLGVSRDGGWILIRKLAVSDPSVQAILANIFPENSQTLIVLPKDFHEMGDVLDVRKEIGEARSGLLQAFDELLAHAEEYGATVEKQPDGTVLLTLPIKGAEAITALNKLTRKAGGHGNIEVAVDDDELLGTTITVVYDPAADCVRSFAIHDLGSPGSRIAITVGEGEVDPKLLDSSRVMTPSTRVFDAGALQSLLDDKDDK